MGHSLLVDRYCQDKISEFMYLYVGIDVVGFRVICRVGWIYYVWLQYSNAPYSTGSNKMKTMWVTPRLTVNLCT